MVTHDWWSRNSSNLSTRLVILFVVILALFQVSRNFGQMRQISIYGIDDALAQMDLPSVVSSIMNNNTYVDRPKITIPSKMTVAYAVTISNFSVKTAIQKGTILDRAAVLHQSIKLAMEKSLRYDYHLYAFVHPDAIEAKPMLERLGYRVQIRDTPFNITDISNPELIEAQNNGCCGEKVSTQDSTHN